jgi:hypothetical protein
MRNPQNRSLVSPRAGHPLARPLMSSLLLWGALWGGACETTDEGENPTGPVRVVISTPGGSATEVNGELLPITVSVFQSNGSPVPAGTRVDVLELGCIDPNNSPPVGLLEVQQGQGPCAAASNVPITSSTGSISFRFQCVREGMTTLLAGPTGSENFGSTTLTCSPGPSGDWTITNISSEGTLLTGSNAITVTAQIQTGEGAPVPQGTRLNVEVVDGQSLVLDNTQMVFDARTDAEGLIEVPMKTTEKDGDTTVQIAFRDERFGPPAQQTFLVRKAGEGGETDLVVTVRKNGQVLDIGERKVLADGEQALDLEVTIIPPASSPFMLEGHEVTITNNARSGYFEEEDGLREVTLETDAQGRVATTFTGGVSPDEAEIVISVTDPNPLGEGAVISETFQIDIIALGAINYEGADPGVLFVRGSGQNESSTIRFKVVDTEDNPLSGVRVSFSLDNPPAGTSIAPSEALSDEEGYVQTIISSGTTAGSAGITARAVLGEVEIEAPSASLPVVGAKPSRKGFDLLCERRNIGGFIGRLGDQITVDRAYACTSVLLDRFGNPVGVTQRVSYFSEGGVINSPQQSVPWDYVRVPTPPSDVGRVGTNYNPRTRPPCDTEPLDEEPFFDQDGDCSVPINGCPEIPSGFCTDNPRDGLVTIIAVTTGEEEFEDRNGNGQYDSGEPYWDLGEPYIDANDNNEWDPGEFFQDLGSEQNPEGNGQYDGPNGQWDALTSIWTSNRVLLTGDTASGGRRAGGQLGPEEFEYPAAFITSYSDPELGDFLEITERASITLPDGVYAAGVRRLWFDDNLNVMNSSTVFSAASSGTPVGITFDLQQALMVVDTYGFEVEQRVSAGQAPNSRVYRTDVNFSDTVIPGVSHGGFVRVTDPMANYSRNATIKFTATYAISPGVGTARAIDSFFTINFPEPPGRP